MAQTPPVQLYELPAKRRWTEDLIDDGEQRPSPFDACSARRPWHEHRCLQCDVRDLALCGALGKGDLPYLEAVASGVSLAAGRTLFGEGDPVRHAYNVTSGTLRLFRLLPDGRRQITGFALAGDFVGLSAHGTHPCWAEAVNPVELCKFPVPRLLDLFVRFPEMEHRLLAMQAKDLVAAQDRMVLLGRMTPIERIASFLREFSVRQERRGGVASPVMLPMARRDIADYLGLTVETVSRCFTRLRRDRVIALPEPARVELTDRSRLDEIASSIECIPATLHGAGGGSRKRA